MKNAKLYTWEFWPFCVNARRLLDKKGIPYEEENIEKNRAKRDELLAQTGQDTVPYVFLDEKFIGGYDDLAALDEEGKL